MKYSFITKGFYEDSHPNLPQDCVNISDEYWNHLITEQAAGAWIIHNQDVLPTLVYPNISAEQQLKEEQELLKVLAYRNEADPLFFKSQRGEATREEWLAKVAEIKAKYP
jgi:hypothetical protein